MRSAWTLNPTKSVAVSLSDHIEVFTSRFWPENMSVQWSRDDALLMLSTLSTLLAKRKP